jgi:hypothetical protein
VDGLTSYVPRVCELPSPIDRAQQASGINKDVPSQRDLFSQMRFVTEVHEDKNTVGLLQTKWNCNRLIILETIMGCRKIALIVVGSANHVSTITAFD